MGADLANFIKYCLGYIKLTRQRGFIARQKTAVEIPSEYLNLTGLINGDTDGSLGELVRLNVFYKIDPKQLVDKSDEVKEQYEAEKQIASKLDDIYNKQKNDPFTKQVVFSFGFFEIEIPLAEGEADDVAGDENGEEPSPNEKVVESIKDRFPLFSIPVKIEKKYRRGVAEYEVYFADTKVQVNIGLLEKVFDKDEKIDLYYQLLERVARYEQEDEDKLSLPILNSKVFTDIWHSVKAQLRLTSCIFDEGSFNLDEMRVALSSRSNYFLAEDLLKLSQIEDSQLSGTSLESWISDEEVREQTDIPQDQDLYFPFLFDKYQLGTLSLLGNKISIIQGPPGTGKSETIANLLCHLAATGKKVLFVSQKAQALKVVKDKLKTLSIRYLFGYIPNPVSAQLGEEDRNDGIAAQLTALSGFVQGIDHRLRGKSRSRAPIEIRSVSSIISSANQKAELQEQYSDLINIQREFFKLSSRLNELNQYDTPVSNLDAFYSEFNLHLHLEINSLKESIKNVASSIQAYENLGERVQFDQAFDEADLQSAQLSGVISGLKIEFQNAWPQIQTRQEQIKALNTTRETYENNPQKEEFDKLFENLGESREKYLADIETLRADISRTAYDRHSRVIRFFNNVRRSYRLHHVIDRIPREVMDLVNNKLSDDVSRSEVANYVDSIYGYFSYHSSLKTISETESEIRDVLREIVSHHSSSMPQQIATFVSVHIVDHGVKKSEAEAFLAGLFRYTRFHENMRELEVLEGNLRSFLDVVGLSLEEHARVDSILSGSGSADHFDEVKSSIIEVYELRARINDLDLGSINACRSDIGEAEGKRKNQIARYIENIVTRKILSSWQQGRIIRGIVAEFARAFKKSKRAFKTFDNLRRDQEKFLTILNLVPIWIMELDDASRIMPLLPSMFDYVILDEASQCNIAYTLPVMFRARHTLFVGDSEQMRDNTVMFRSNRAFDELAMRYQIPEKLQIKSTGNAVQSVLDIAEREGFLSRSLQNYYRSPSELIGFSNEYFYIPRGKELIPLNSNYLTYNETNRIMVIHQIEPRGDEEISDKINMAEAEKILELFRQLREDLRYKNKSIGILSFFNLQAAYIRKLFEENGYTEEKDNYKVSIIEGIQGDEKDIIIYSFVIRSKEQKNRYISLTGESGDIRSDINKGRVNVAFSRAKLQTHCVTSMPISGFPDGIWLKKYLKYVEEHGEVNFCSTELKPFDSYFEEEFYGEAKIRLGGGYIIQNQVKSCGFKIDFVVTNTHTSKRLAIECDGPTHFKDEIDDMNEVYIESDEERQQILEAAGWTFYRIRYSTWISENCDRRGLIEDIKNQLG